MADLSKNNANLELLKDVTRERNDLAQRLARFEFHAMTAELAEGGAFIVANGSIPHNSAASDPMHTDTDGLPKLNVPLGRIAWHADPKSLPAIAILMEDRSTESVAGLLSLLQEFHAAPFARIVFITRHLDMVPFFDRYGFAVVCVGSSSASDAGTMLFQRFGISQIRDVKDGTPVWTD